MDTSAITDYVEALQSNLEEAHAHARDHLQRSAEYQKRYYDHRATEARKYEVGQAVWYFNSQRKKGVCKKLTSQWRGPYVVVQRINDVTYKIQFSLRTDAFVCHVDTLKLYEGENAPQWYRHSEHPRSGRGGD